ncbi:hypothetical protein EAF00_003588 [Botryotinia globosa]|nr:hypothetical protein EAF00_003588 [Botryotinia globosa]
MTPKVLHRLARLFLDVTAYVVRHKLTALLRGEGSSWSPLQLIADHIWP